MSKIYDSQGSYCSRYDPNDGVTSETRNTVIDWFHSIKNIITISKMTSGTNPNFNDLIYTKKIIVNDHHTNELNEEHSDINIESDTDEKDQPESSLEIVSEDFWLLINKAQWCDNDERTLSKMNITRVFTREQRNHILLNMNNHLIPQLTRVVADVHLQDLVEENFINVLAHIIMKGKNFYEAIIIMPEVCLYLNDKFYPVYDWLR